MQASDIQALVAEDFAAANTLIRKQLHSDVPLVETIGQYIVDSGGKRLRPLLVILVSRALGSAGPAAISLATVIEFLHTATLLHDDVVDASSLRRGRSTANTRWGNAPSVLVGDFLYSRAFQMMVALDKMAVLRELADATNVISEGEVLQLSNCRNPDLTEQRYFDVISAKTARLFEAASHSAALLCDCPADESNALARFGHHLGIAFQLADDALDYRGDPQEMGKNVGDDLAEGKMTLPLILAGRSAGTEDVRLLHDAIRKGRLEALPEVLRIVEQSGALEATMQRAAEYASRAREALAAAGLPPGPYREALTALTDIAVNRYH